MKEFKKGEFESFACNGLFEFNNKTYLSLSKYDKHTFRATAYDYQSEWEESNLPEIVKCYVADVDYRGLPRLEQAKSEVFKNLYTETDFYPFKLLAKKEDLNTGVSFYELKDPFGLYHRYYLNNKEENYEVGDVISFWVDGFEDKGNNKVYLKLEHIPKEQTKDKTSVVEENKTPIENDVAKNIDPRKESKFGFENDVIEFKSSIAYPAGNTISDIDKQLEIITKTIAGFQNANGGELYIGVDDAGNVVGIEHDFKHLNSSENDKFSYELNIDGYQLKLRNAIKYKLGNRANSHVSIKFEKESNLIYCIVEVAKCAYPVFLGGYKLFERTGNMAQILKNDEISFFIESRFNLRNNLNLPKRNIETDSKEEELVNNKESVSFQSKPVSDNLVKNKIENIIHEPLNYNDLWIHINLFKNGDWSYSKKQQSGVEILKSVPIPKTIKKGFLVMAYDNGRLNIVSLYDLIRPKSRTTNKRKTRPENKVYTTGWNTSATLIDVFGAKQEDLLCFESKDGNANEWIKCHHASHISVHDINAQGNVLINEKLEYAKLTNCKRIPLEYYSQISGLVLKEHLTSSSLGFQKTDRNLSKAIKLVSKINTNNTDA